MLKESAGELPICTVEKLNHEVKNLPLVKRALEMLSLWGECVYFSQPEELAGTVILHP